MRIEGYPPFPTVRPTASGKAPAQNAAAEELSPQDKFARLLDEKRRLTEIAFEGNPEGELGKHIDLRV